MFWGSGIPMENFRDLSFVTKVGMFEGVVTSTMLHSSETWTLNNRKWRRVEVLDMKCLRMGLGVNFMDRIRNSVI